MLSGRIRAANFGKVMLLDGESEFALELMNDEFVL